MWLFNKDYLFIELPENMLYPDIYSYGDIKLPISGQKILTISPSPMLEAYEIQNMHPLHT